MYFYYTTKRGMQIDFGYFQTIDTKKEDPMDLLCIER
jgi:hypothetical protein